MRWPQTVFVCLVPRYSQWWNQLRTRWVFVSAYVWWIPQLTCQNLSLQWRHNERDGVYKMSKIDQHNTPTKCKHVWTMCIMIRRNATKYPVVYMIWFRGNTINSLIIFSWRRHDMEILTKLLGAVSIRKTVLPGMAIPMLKIRRPNGRLIFNMEIAIRR